MVKSPLNALNKAIHKPPSNAGSVSINLLQYKNLCYKTRPEYRKKTRSGSEELLLFADFFIFHKPELLFFYVEFFSLSFYTIFTHTRLSHRRRFWELAESESWFPWQPEQYFFFLSLMKRPILLEKEGM